MVGERDNPRSQVSRQILSSRQRFTFDDWSAVAFDTRMGEAEIRLPALVGEWQALAARTHRAPMH